MKVAIIGGSGKMGQWFAKFLIKEGNEVVITGRDKKKLLEVKEKLGVESATNIEAVKNSKVILLAVPIDNFEEVVKEICPYTRPDQFIIDITSIKVLPVEIMHKYIKRGLVLGMHPMFGPGAKDIAGQNFILTPTSEKEANFAQRVKEYLEARGARVSLMTPHEHDEMMAVILGLSHFIATVSADTLLSFDGFEQRRAISGVTYRVLLTLVESVISEDPELYASLQMNLPKMVEVEELFQTKAKIWADLVKNKDKREFVRRMNSLKEKLEKVDPGFRKAYENLYEIVKGISSLFC